MIGEMKEYSLNENGAVYTDYPVEENTILVKDAIFVRHKGNLVKVKFVDILWMKGDGNYTTLVTRQEVYSLRNILKELESVLPVNEFIRIHKSYVVRLDEIVCINPRELTVAKDTVRDCSIKCVC